MKEESDYETLPYSNSIFPQTYVDKLCSSARLFGLDAPDIETARVLELGCGNGLNLISQAYSLPKASFLGVDLAKTHIDFAVDSARELGLSNIEFKQCDLMEMTLEEFGRFDYIIAHGLISWIPEIVREKTFLIYEEMLTEKGVGYISYNTYPGCHYRQMVRGIARIHTKDFSHPAEIVENASAFINFLSKHSVGKDVYRSIIESESEYYANPTMVYHDNLAEINEPYYFYEFAGKLYEHGLQFLAESQVGGMFTCNYPPEPKAFLERIDDIIGKGQYMDFFTGRSFRQSLFCRKNIELNHDPSPEAIGKLYLAAPITPLDEKSELTNDDIVKFSGFAKSGIEINHPLTKVALYLLGKEWGDVVLLDELLLKAEKHLEEKGIILNKREEEFEAASRIILQIVTGLEAIELHSRKTDIYTTLDEKPKLNHLAEWLLSKGDLIYSAYERTLEVKSPTFRKMVELFDGTNTRDDLRDHLTEFIKSKADIENKNEMIENLDNDLTKYLNDFAKTGLFVQNIQNEI